MSSYCDERADVYNETWRRAIKVHACEACHRAIAKGERYARVFIAFDDAARAYVRCVGCQTIHEHLRTLDEGEMWPDERLNCGEEYTEHWGKEPPELIAALAFATPDEALHISQVIRFRKAAHLKLKRRGGTPYAAVMAHPRPEVAAPVCEECGGATIEFRGRGLNTEHKVCSRYQQPGHLSLDEVRAKLAEMRRLACPSGRLA